VKRNVSIVRTL